VDLLHERGPRDLPLPVLYTAAGFGFGMRIAQLAAIPADVFAGPHLGAILGVVQAGRASVVRSARFSAAGSST
jgi:hypothetical protein